MEVEDDQIKLVQRMTDYNLNIDDCSHQLAEVTQDLKNRNAHAKILKNEINTVSV